VEDVEIIPQNWPSFQPVVLDRVAEVKTALENREELTQAKLGIDAARIQVGAAKVQALPQLDLTFRYTVDGLGTTLDNSFDELTKNDYDSYYLAIEFELPVGNRARRAQLRRAVLEHAKAIAGLKQAFEQVIFEVNRQVRTVQVNYDQIDPSLQAAEATEDQVQSIIARAEKKDFLTLNTELNTRQTLAQAQRDLLSSLIDYSIALVDLEKAKGTLLRYNNIELVFNDDEKID
jgi:outer membrane protein TolC